MNISINNRLLIVDDNPAIHDDFRKILNNSAGNPQLENAESILFGESASLIQQTEFQITSAYQGKEALSLVEQALANGEPFSVAFVDVRMPPGWDGIETIARIWEVQPDLQVVICTAYSDYSWDDMIAKLGKSDSLLILKKPFDNIEVLQFAHALTKKWLVTKQASMRVEELDVLVRQRTLALQSTNDRLMCEIGERTQAQEALRLSEERFSKAFQASPVSLAIQTLGEQRFVDVNLAFVNMTGHAREVLIGSTAAELKLCVDLNEQIWTRLRREKAMRNIECRISTKTGELRRTLLSMELFTLNGEPHVLMLAEDITERLKLEQELRQAQKMEAVGRLAAGVAHDFNNVLTIIQGHASLQLATNDLDRDVAESLKQVSAAAERAANLTRQLLAFSRKTVMQPKRLDLNTLVGELTAVLPRLIGEHIEIHAEPGQNLPCIFADATNMEQIVINLAANARDAMPNGGLLTIRTGEVNVGADHLLRVPDAAIGRHICLAVSDTGCGMDAHTRRRIFEPFFTTKEVGKGTGMGLATVYGIVKQHNGWLEVESEPGSGSTFKVFLPVCQEGVEMANERVEHFSNPFGRNRTVLVVEDDPSVRGLVKEILLHYRYRVLEASDAHEALDLAREYGNEIVLLLTDMIMPGGISGRELAERLLAERPELKVIYTSGYSPELFAGDLHLREGFNYLPKPYTSAMLTSAIRNALENNEPSVEFLSL